MSKKRLTAEQIQTLIADAIVLIKASEWFDDRYLTIRSTVRSNSRSNRLVDGITIQWDHETCPHIRRIRVIPSATRWLIVGDVNGTEFVSRMFTKTVTADHIAFDAEYMYEEMETDSLRR